MCELSPKIWEYIKICYLNFVEVCAPKTVLSHKQENYKRQYKSQYLQNNNFMNQVAQWDCVNCLQKMPSYTIFLLSSPAVAPWGDIKHSWEHAYHPYLHFTCTSHTWGNLGCYPRGMVHKCSGLKLRSQNVLLSQITCKTWQRRIQCWHILSIMWSSPHNFCMILVHCCIRL